MLLALSHTGQILATIGGYILAIGALVLSVGFVAGLIYWIVQAIKYPTREKYYEKFGEMPKNIFVD